MIDANGNQTGLTDPDGNQTTWQFNGLGQATVETNALAASSYAYYNAAGELTETIDADGRAILYSYDGVGRETSENWYNTSDTSGSPTETIGYAYNAAGLLESATDYNVANDTTSTDSYIYDAAGEVTSDTQQIPGLTPVVTLSSQYTAGNRTQLAAAIGGTNDFVNNYQYDSVLGQISQVTQTSNGGDAVAAKTATFAYNSLGEFSTIAQYQNADATANLVATGAYSCNSAGELTSIGYSDGQSTPATLVNFGWTYDPLGNVLTSSSTLDGMVSYTSDSTGQLTSASGGQAPSVSYQYDANGNRETVTTSGSAVTSITGANNELLFDGTYHYEYDAAGNRIARWQARVRRRRPARPAGATDIVFYGWDNRDRMTSATTYADYTSYAAGSPEQTATYAYDALDRWIGETVTAGTTVKQTAFIYDGTQMVMQFDSTGSPLPSGAG